MEKILFSEHTPILLKSYSKFSNKINIFRFSFIAAKLLEVARS